MKSRLERYNTSDDKEVAVSRLAKNKHLYDDLNNKIGFEELVDFNTQTRIELTSLNEKRKSRESYQQLKDYKSLINDNYKEEETIVEEEKEKNFDINSILEEARKNRNEIDEKEKKRKLKSEEYNVLSDLNKKYLNKEKEDKYEGLEELINTITSKTLAQDIKNAEENVETDADLFSDLVATNVDLQVKAPEEYEKETLEDSIVTKLEADAEDTIEEKVIDDSFYTRSMDLSEHDFDFDEENERKSSVKRGVLISLVVIVLIAIILVVGYFTLEHFGINIKEFIK